MQAAVITEPGSLVIRQTPDPVPGNGQVVVDVGACGVCGIGAGDRVAVDPSLFCGHCAACRAGRGNLCANWGAIGDTVDGAFAERVAVPAVNGYRLPDHLSLEQGALVEPLSCAVHGVRRLGTETGESMLVVGAGTMGLLLIQLLAGAGVRVTAVDRVASKLDPATKFGAIHTATSIAELHDERYDAVVDVTGAPAIEDCLDAVRRGGRFLVFGVANAQARVAVSPFRIYNDEITIVGSLAVLHSFGAALDLIATGSISTDGLVSHRLPLDGYLVNLQPYIDQTEGYDGDDFIPSVRDSLSYEGDMYSVPFYGESSFLVYRKDLFEQAGLTMPAHPTWPQIADFAAKLDDPGSGRTGICLRGLSGRGENLASLDTVVNTFGGRWFDEDWNAQLDSPEFEKAVRFYVDLVQQYGEPGAATSGYSECITRYSQGQAAMWYDATAMMSTIESPADSQGVGQNGYAPAPVVETDSSGWLYTWSLGIPESSEHADEAWEFLSWMTSKDYLHLVGDEIGWEAVPPGSRLSTYQIPEYAKVAKAYARGRPSTPWQRPTKTMPPSTRCRTRASSSSASRSSRIWGRA